jgi:hypothetical protein
MRVYVCIALVMSLVSVALPSDNSGDVFYEEVPRITKDRKILMRPELAAKPRLKRTSKLVIFEFATVTGKLNFMKQTPLLDM